MSFRNLGLISKLSWLDLKKASGWRWSCKIIKYRFYPSQTSEITNLKSLNLHSRILSAVNVSSRISISNFWNRHERSLSSLSLCLSLSASLFASLSVSLSVSLSPPLSRVSLSATHSFSGISRSLSLSHSLSLMLLCILPPLLIAWAGSQSMFCLCVHREVSELKHWWAC